MYACIELFYLGFVGEVGLQREFVCRVFVQIDFGYVCIFMC